MKKILILFLILFFLAGCSKIPEIIKDNSFCEFDDKRYDEGKITEQEDEGVFYEMQCEDGQWVKLKKIDYICKPYIENGPVKDSFNLIFVNNLNYGFEDTVDNLMNGLFDYTPFSSYKDKFNVFLIYGNIDEIEIEEITQKCKISKAYLILLDDSWDVSDSSTFAINDGKYDKPVYMILFTKTSTETQHLFNRIFVHEFGHLFARLDDEYIVDDINKPLLGGGNCDDNIMFIEDKPICNKWPEYTGCFKGCTSPDYYRSSYDSIMQGDKSKDLSLGFNVVSQMILKERLSPSLIQSISRPPYYDTGESIKVLFNWDGIKLSIFDIKPSKDKIRPPTDKGKYTLKILDYYGKVLFVTRFNIINSSYCTYSGECHTEEMKSFSITTPHQPWARKVVILEDDKIIASQDIGFRSVSEGSREGINKVHPIWLIIGIIIVVIIFKDKLLKTMRK